MTNHTPYLDLTLPDFDQITWHTQVNGNFLIIDAAIAAFSGITITGIWLNDKNYYVGDYALDVDGISLWRCEVANLSPQTGSFQEYRSNNPTHWSLYADIIQITQEAKAAALASQLLFDNFNDIYLGPFTQDPLTDNDGDPLQSGALYFNTAFNEMRVWNIIGQFWIPIVSGGGGGGIADGDKGDILVSGGGSVWLVDQNAVTFPKMQDINTGKLIGRSIAGVGDPMEILVAGGLEFTGTNLQRSALTGDVTAPAGSNVTTIATNSLVFGKLQQIPTDTLVGRDTAGVGDMEIISLNATLSFTGAGSIQRAALTGDVTASAGSNATTISPNAVSFSKLQQIATDRLIGRDTPATGNAEEITVSGGLEWTGSLGIQRSALSGDVSAPAGSNTTTVGINIITNAKLADMTAPSFKGRVTAGLGDPEDLTIAQATGLLNNFTGDAGSGGIKGLVPGPAAGDTAAGKFLSAIGGWGIPPGTGGVSDGDKGDVTVAAGIWTIDPNVVTHAKYQQINQAVILGRDVAGGTGNVTSLSQVQSTAIILPMVGDSGAGGTKGLAPAPAAGDAAGGKFLSAAATWLVPGVVDNTVTFAKLQDIPTDTLIGRDAAGTGDPTSITLQGTLEFTGGNAIQRAALTGDVTALAGFNATTISNNAVTNLHLRDSGGLTVIGRSAQAAGDPGDIFATAGSGAVLREQGNVLGFGTVVTGGIADNAINFIKMQDIPTDSLMGRDTAASGDPESILLNTTLVFDGALNLGRAALTGEVTAGLNSNALTITAGAVTDAKLRNSAALSVIGRSANSVGVPADIAATFGLGGVLRESGGVLGFGTLATVGHADNSVTFGKMQDISTDRLIGRDTAATGDPEEIAVIGGLEFTTLGSIQRSAIGGDVAVPAGSTNATINSGVVTFAKMANLATDTLIGRDTAGAGVPEAITLQGTLEFTGAGQIQRAALTGDVTALAGFNATTIANNAVTHAKYQQITQGVILGRNVSGGTGNVESLTQAQSTAILLPFVGDSGSGGTKGLVPAPAAGDTVAGKFLSAIGGWSVPGGGSGGSSFPAGTIMLFQQTSAPTGWTKLTTNNDKAIRIVSGSVTTGGTIPFSTLHVAAYASAGYVLTNADVPDNTVTTSARQAGAGNTVISAGHGGAVGGPHSHNIAMDVQYVDVIAASKD